MTEKEKEELWYSGFNDGIDAELSELYEAAEVLNPEYIKVLDLLLEQIEQKYADDEDSEEEEMS